jgi:hypothetical protein
VDTTSGAGPSTGAGSGPFSLPFAFPRDLRWDFGLGGLCLGVTNGTKSSIFSIVGRGLATGVPEKLAVFHLLLAETGVPMALCGDRELIGVE